MHNRGSIRAESTVYRLLSTVYSSMNDRELKALCRAVGDVTRMRIVRHLCPGNEINVSDLAGFLALSQPLGSGHLRILKRAGILGTRKDGRQVYCSLDRRRLTQFRQALGDLIQNRAGQEPGPSLLPESALLAD